jgi:uncharacterized YccA/Bax inhibitor family protein
MEFGRSSNPTLKDSIFKTGDYAYSDNEVMTIQGTVNKIFIMLLLVVLGAVYTWNIFYKAVDPASGASGITGWLIGGALGGFVLALVITFKRDWSPYLAPIYAVLEGLFLGGISALFEAKFHGIVIQAVALTFGTLFCLLFLYKSRIINVTEKFKLGVFAATGAIALFYLVIMVLNMFHVNVDFYAGNSLFSIGISVFIVIIAALNLVLDFDFIEKGAVSGAPKYMEWYGAFGLMVTLVWLYLEILRLLSKLNSRN